MQTLFLYHVGTFLKHTEYLPPRLPFPTHPPPLISSSAQNTTPTPTPTHNKPAHQRKSTTTSTSSPDAHAYSPPPTAHSPCPHSPPHASPPAPPAPSRTLAPRPARPTAGTAGPVPRSWPRCVGSRCGGRARRRGRWWRCWIGWF